MVNYSDGKWHGWNGGECPVHPRTVVQVRLCDRSEEYGDMIDPASGWDWSYEIYPPKIIAFRVVKEHREPRDFWLVHVPGDVTEFTLHHCEAAALLEQREEGGRILHVREVL